MSILKTVVCLVIATLVSATGNNCVKAQDGFVVTEIAGNLIITGDNGDDQIRIEPLQFKNYTVPDAFVVSFNWRWVGSGSNRRYEPEWQASFYDVENIAIEAGEGNNDVGLLHGCDLAGSLSIEVGDGTNLIFVYEGNFDGDVDVIAGNGGNTINIHSTAIEGDLLCETGSGNDRFNFLHRFLKDVRVAGDTIIDLGNGNDLADVVSFQCESGLRVDMGSGADRVKMSSNHLDIYIMEEPTTVAGNCVIAHSGFGYIDAIVQDIEIEGSLFFLAKGGDDFLSLKSRTYYSYQSPMRIGGHVFAFCGNGNDRIFTSGLSMKNGTFYSRLEAGQDWLTIEDSDMQKMDIDLGSNKDSFEMNGSFVQQSAKIDGGSSEDTGDLFNTQAGSIQAKNFEVGNLAN